MTVLSDVLISIVRNLLPSVVRNVWRCVARFVTRQYIRLDSTQRYIGTRRQWREPRKLHTYTHRIIEAFAGILYGEYIDWREATEKRNAELVRQRGFVPYWKRYSQTKIENCLVNTSFKQFLELKWDEYLAQILAANKPISLNDWAQNDRTERDEYKHEYDKHIEFIENRARYEAVLEWGFRSNRDPYIAAKVYEEKELAFPEDYHIHYEGVRNLNFGHIYRFIFKNIPERLWQ